VPKKVEQVVRRKPLNTRKKQQSQLTIVEIKRIVPINYSPE